jgi:hypothetical protein
MRLPGDLGYLTYEVSEPDGAECLARPENHRTIRYILGTQGHHSLSYSRGWEHPRLHPIK